MAHLSLHNIERYAKIEEVEVEYFDIFAIWRDGSTELLDTFSNEIQAKKVLAENKKSWIADDVVDYKMESRIECEEQKVYDFPEYDD